MGDKAPLPRRKRNVNISEGPSCSCKPLVRSCFIATPPLVCVMGRARDKSVMLGEMSVNLVQNRWEDCG